MIFDLFSNWFNRRLWQRHLIEVMAKLAVDYNSYYQRVYNFTDLLLKKPVQLLVSTQFVESRVRFKNGTALPILVLEFDFKHLQKLDFKHVEVFKSKYGNSSDKVRIFIPEPLSEHFNDIIDTLQEAAENKHSQEAIRFSKDL